MADRHDYYFGEVVTESELDEGFDFQEQADWDQNRDAGLYGIVIPRYDEVPETIVGINPYPTSWTPRENSPADWNVIVDTGYAYDKLGRRLAVDPPTTALLDCSEDYLSVSNAVGVGKERWISIFLKFVRSDSDARTDDDGLPIWFLQEESYELEVRQGPEETAPATTKPPVDSQAILLADILIDNGMPPIEDADMHFDRTEKLVHLDTSGVAQSPPWVWPNTFEGRNVEEALMHAFYLMQQYVADNFLPLWGDDVSGRMEGDLLPETTCDYLLGSTTKRWQQLWSQAINERPNYTDSGISKFTVDADWEGQNGHASPVKKFEALNAAYVAEKLDQLARRHRRYLDVREDFLYYNGHAGPFPFKITVGATGSIDFNPSAYAQDMPNGFAEFLTPANGDTAKITLSSFPFLADLDSYVEWALNVQTTTGTTLIQAGMVDTSLSLIFMWIFDPAGVLNPGTPNGNWWMVYQDGTNADIWIDSGVTPAAAFQTFSVAFEYQDLAGPVWIRWYKNGVFIDERDLNALGGTYQALALAAAFDLICAMQTTTGGEKLWADYYEAKQLRDF